MDDKKVRVTPRSPERPSSYDANGFEAEDDYLIISNGPRVLAIWAPGTWTRAEFTE